MKMSNKQTYIKRDWLEKEEYKNWLKPYIDKKIEFCGKCRKTIELPNMGEQPSKPHMKGKKDIANSKLVTCFPQPKAVSLVQPVVTAINDGSSASFTHPLTVSTSQKNWQSTCRLV